MTKTLLFPDKSWMGFRSPLALLEAVKLAPVNADFFTFRHIDYQKKFTGWTCGVEENKGERPDGGKYVYWEYSPVFAHPKRRTYLIKQDLSIRHCSLKTS